MTSCNEEKTAPAANERAIVEIRVFLWAFIVHCCGLRVSGSGEDEISAACQDLEEEIRKARPLRF